MIQDFIISAFEKWGERVDFILVGGLIWLLNEMLFKRLKELHNEWIPLITVGVGVVIAIPAHLVKGGTFGSASDWGTFSVSAILYAVTAFACQVLVKRGIFDLTKKLLGELKGK